MKRNQYQVEDKVRRPYGGKEADVQEAELLGVTTRDQQGEESGIFLPRWPLAHGALWGPPIEQR